MAELLDLLTVLDGASRLRVTLQLVVDILAAFFNRDAA